MRVRWVHPRGWPGRAGRCWPVTIPGFIETQNYRDPFWRYQTKNPVWVNRFHLLEIYLIVVKIDRKHRKTEKKEEIKIVDNWLAPSDTLRIPTKKITAKNDRI